MAVIFPNCLLCIHYFITHDPEKPYGCRALRFKSRTIPSRVVFESSGMNCQLFAGKKRQKDGSGNSRVA
ncbi:MAG: uracil-DNA glycosylase [Desulforhopalus sp.]|nr:uracil-DNA glycosylase [Desulforhopalus sp.]